MEMKLLDFLKQNHLIIDFGTRFAITEEGSIGTSEEGDNDSLYCYLRAKDSVHLISQYNEGGVSHVFRGNGFSFSSALMSLVLKLEQFGRENAEIGTERRKIICHVTRFDTSGIKYPR